MVRIAVCSLFAVLAACGPTQGDSDATTQASTGSDTGPAPTGGTADTTSPTTTSSTTATTGDGTTGPGVTGTGATGTSTTGATTIDATTGETSTTGTGTSTDTSSDTGAAMPCQTPTDCQPIFLELGDDMPSDIESGWVICNEESVYYREKAVDCVFAAFWPACEGQPGECAVDADCPGKQDCVNQYGTCACAKQCMSDGECEDGEICMCAESSNSPGWLAILNTCVPADCSENADCTGECGCRGSQFFCGTIESAQCPTVADECSDDDDCGDGYCGWNHDETRWTCEQYGQCE